MLGTTLLAATTLMPPPALPESLRRHLLPLAALLVTLAGMWLLWSSHWLSLTELQAHHQELSGKVNDHPLAAYAGFFIVFVLATTFSVPAATVLTLVIGSLFDFAEALLLVALASSSGATLAMLMSRHIFRPTLEARWPDMIARINRGLKRDGDFYLLALRLAPTPPYFLVNLLMGMTRMPARRFFVITLIGMLPLDILFVLAGRTLATLTGTSDILDLRTLAVLTLAGLLPLLLRQLMRVRNGSTIA
ncbi:MAG: VTT domain-containing protein [Moraxellaceae bacterium]|nr:VTT domain-containing protein [Moraxellaceae bacterium]